MKFILISDIHEEVEFTKVAVKFANKNDAYMIVSGDFLLYPHEETKDIFKEIFDNLSKCKKSVFVIPGNVESKELWKTVKDFPNIIDLHLKTYLLEDVLLVGYGGADEIHGPFDELKNFKVNVKKDKKYLSKELTKTQKTIFVTHMPPHTYRDKAIFKIVEGDFVEATIDDPDAKTAIAGNKVLKAIVEKTKPLLCVFGHIHESGGFEELFTHKKVSESEHLLVNPSPLKGFLVEVKEKVKILKEF